MSFLKGAIRRRFAALKTSLRDLRSHLAQSPEDIGVISAHWEEGLRRDGGAVPRIVHHYGGFPECRKVQYPTREIRCLSLHVCCVPMTGRR
jgi:aromatic ring-opening dioxygenase catalytic subunit (LigB family)